MTATGHIGRYELIARLGAGGMGEIFLARTVGSGGFEKQVVIKRILPHLAGDPDFVQRIVDEGKLVVQLRHTCIAQVLDMGEDGGATYIAMEYVDGRDLAELMRLARAGGVETPVSLVATLLARLLEGLDYAHHATDRDGRPMGIIHRDVSPSNVMISKAGEVKLLDFGIARAAERAHVTVSGAIRGKYNYMSPEQAKGGELDARSDLFSLGVVAWELFTGARPFDAPSDLLTLDRVRFHDPGPLAAVAPDVPVELCALVDRLLQKEASARYDSAADALRALQGYLQGEGTVVLARDIAAWFERVQATLPPGLRDRPVANLSLDDALLLGLPADPSRATGTAPRVGTVAIPGPPGAAGPVTGRAPRPTTTEEVSVVQRSRRRGGPMALLVGLNLVLIGIVAWYVLNDGEDPRATTVAGEPTPALGVATSAPPVAPPARDPSDAADASGEREASADVAAVVAGADAAPAEVAAPEPAAELLAGALAGEALGTIEVPAAPVEVAVLFRTTPDKAMVAIEGRGSAPAPRRLVLPAGTHLKVTVKAAGYAPKSLTLVAARDDVVAIKLEPLPTGLVTFRFRPAQNTRVLIDGKRVDPGGKDIITETLAVGPHRLVLMPPEGPPLERAFEILEGKTLSLGTLDAARPE